MKRNVIVLLMAALVLFLIGGFSGISLVQGSVRAEEEKPDIEVGVLITLDESLPWEEGIVEAKYDETEHEYEFGIDGAIPFFYTQIGDIVEISWIDDAISESSIGISNTDEGMTATLKCTLYKSDQGSIDVFYFNPVYQREDGSVYAVSGNGMQLGIAETTFTTEETVTITENGKKQIRCLKQEIRMATMQEPVEIRLLQMDENHTIIRSETYAPKMVPETLIPEEDAEYLIVETETRSGTEHALYQKGDMSFTTYSGREDGLMVGYETMLGGEEGWE